MEHQSNRKDAYRLAWAFVEHFVHRYAAPPAALVLDLAHPEALSPGQPALACSNHPYRTYSYLPLCMVKGPSRALVTACRRPGVRPKGAENAMMVARLLSHRRQHWPATPILGRGASHVATPELMHVLATHPLRDFVFGLSTHALLKRPAAAALAAARQRHLYRLTIAQANGTLPLRSRRVYDAFRHGAAAVEPCVRTSSARLAFFVSPSTWLLPHTSRGATQAGRRAWCACVRTGTWGYPPGERS